MLIVRRNILDTNELLQKISESGIDIRKEGSIIFWSGPYGGKIKPNGPLAGKKIGIMVGSDFSDWQAYYLAVYIGEYGGMPQFILDNNHLWKVSRFLFGNGVPVEPTGRWGYTFSVGLGLKETRILSPALLQPGKGHVSELPTAKPDDYDALIIVGGWSGDVLYADDKAVDFIKAVVKREVPIAAIGEGILPLIKIGILHGRHVTGNKLVDYMLKKIAKFHNEPVIRDDNVITAQNTVDTPTLLRELCKVFEPSFHDIHKDLLREKRILFMVADDFEDIELCVPVLEFMYRGAEVTIGLFKPYIRSRPPLVGFDVRIGNFGVSIPFQEIPDNLYSIIPSENIKMSDFDLLFIPGAMNPLHIAALHTDFIKNAYNSGKIIAAICHGPIALAAADLVAGKKLTGWLACKDPIEIMGGEFVPNYAAVICDHIVSGRTPPEIPEFLDACTIALLKEF